MAKQTGQITVVKNNTVTNVEHQIRFIFTKENGERITRDTTNKGVINFDIPNGDWNVSWFAVDGDQKVLPLRAGLQLKITSSTPTTALADWIYGDNTHVADPILTQWTNVLDEMKAVRDEFRKETSFVGDKNEPIMRRGYNGYGSKSTLITSDQLFDQPIENGSYYITSGWSELKHNHLLPEGWINGGASYVTVHNHSTNLTSYTIATMTLATKSQETCVFFKINGVWTKGVLTWNKNNTTVGNHGQLHDGTGTPKDLLAVGDFGVGTANPQPIDFDRISSEINSFFANTRGAHPSFPLYQGSKAGIILKRTPNITHVINIGINGQMQLSTNWNDDWKHHNTFLTTGNTIIDSNGNYKPASPVIQLHHNKVEYNEDFDKDNPPKFEHLETGVYRITNAREICKDGWTYNKPLNGKSQPYFMIKYEQEDATTLLVRVFERTFNSKTGEFGFGEPRDIGADERWVDFHFEVDHERIAREEAQMQKEQEEFEEQERLRKEAEEQEQAEATAAWEAEMAKHEKELLAEMEAEHKEE